MPPDEVCPRCDRPRIPDSAWSESFTKACDLGPNTTMKAWRTEFLAEWPGHCDSRNVATCSGPQVDWRARALRAERELCGMGMDPPGPDNRLDWEAVRDAGKAIARHAADRFFSPPWPEGGESDFKYASRVGDELQKVGTALKLRPAAIDGMVTYRKLAQDLLTAYQRYAYNADGAPDQAIEDRADAFGLDTKAWL